MKIYLYFGGRLIFRSPYIPKFTVSEYYLQLAWQRENKKEQRAKASSFSFSGFSPLIPVPLTVYLCCLILE